MKKFSFLIVCLFAGLGFIGQAQSSDTPSLNGAGAGGWQDQPIIRTRLFSIGSGDEINGTGLGDQVKGTIKPGNEPNVVPSGSGAPSLNGAGSGWGNPLVGKVLFYGVQSVSGGTSNGDSTDSNEGSPLDGLEKGRVRPSGGSGDAVRVPQQGLNGISMVTSMIDALLSGSTDMPDVNGDGNLSIGDITKLIDKLLNGD